MLLLWGISAMAAVMLAMGKDRNPATWLVASFALGPLVPACLLMLPASGRDPSTGIEREAMELCPACSEPVRRDREACRYCGDRPA